MTHEINDVVVIPLKVKYEHVEYSGVL